MMCYFDAILFAVVYKNFWAILHAISYRISIQFCTLRILLEDSLLSVAGLTWFIPSLKLIICMYFGHNLLLLLFLFIKFIAFILFLKRLPCFKANVMI